MRNRLVLASASPRRIELLRRIVPPFEVFAPDVDETLDGRFRELDQVVVDLACATADQAATRTAAMVILAADTLVGLDGQPLGKPASSAGASAVLSTMSRRTVQVATGTVVLERGEFRHQVVTSELVMNDLDPGTIADYVASGAWAGKAGGLEVQDRARHLVAEVRGCWTNVIGLPLCAAAQLLGVPYPAGSCRVP
jgi:septum formation protein